MADDTNTLAPQGALTRRAFLRTLLALAGGGASAAILAACAPTNPQTGGPAGPTSGAVAAPTTGVAGAPSLAPTVVSGPAKKVSVRFNFTMKGEYSPFFVAMDKGFYKAEGLEVEGLEGKSGTQAVQAVGTGNDPFGYIPSIQVLEGINQGVPLKSIATMGRYTGMCWVSRQNVPLDGPQALEGHKVSISSSSTFFQVWDAFAKKFNVDKSKVNVVNADPSARVGLFLNKQVDIMADVFIANDYVIIKDKVKEPLNLLKMSDLNFDPLGYLLVVNNSVLQNDHDMVQRFHRATLQGFADMLKNPEDAVKIMSARFGTRLSENVLRGQITEANKLIITNPALGRATPNEWTQTLELLSSSGVLKKTLRPSEYHTDEFGT